MFSVEELSQEIAVLAVHIDAATHRLLECIRHFDEACGWYKEGAQSCAHWLAWRVGWDPATAREKVRVARALGKLPAIDQALETGKLSYAKARALTRIAKPETEAELVAMSAYATGAQLERLCRGYRRVLAGDESPAPEERTVRRRDLPGGMVRLEITLNPDEADLVMRALDCAREKKHASEPAAASAAVPAPTESAADVSAETSTPWPSRADAMVAVAEGYLAGNTGTGTGGERFQVMIHVDQDPLAPDGALAASDRVGSPPASPAAYHRGGVWGPSQGPHFNQPMAAAFPRKRFAVSPATAAWWPYLATLAATTNSTSAAAAARFHPPFVAPCRCGTEAAAFLAAPTRAFCTATTSATGFTADRRA
jgi:hypothetical protein